ncbi:HPr kinase/phosphorylase [Novosphingobium sp. MBES04]|uniref:HPr kinase/phosphorylase n=1 Tax=Novosphingobium sp. MBES04 TaxID=1206458 RepID=UPI0030EB3655
MAQRARGMTTGASPSLVRQATCVACAGRAILIEGPSGAGKTSLALELIDRGAVLVGDDGVVLEPRAGHLVARPHPRTAGLIEVRNLGILDEPFCAEARVCLHILLDSSAPRFIEKARASSLRGWSFLPCAFRPRAARWPSRPNARSPSMA